MHDAPLDDQPTTPTTENDAMTRRRKPMEIWPEEVQALMYNAELPVMLMDWLITRRQRIHALSFPRGEDYMTSRHASECLEAAWINGYRTIALICELEDGSWQGCNITLSEMVEDIELAADAGEDLEPGTCSSP